MAETQAIHCVRCGREGVPEFTGPLPDGWDGVVHVYAPHEVHEAVCPDCLLIEWHPSCRSCEYEDTTVTATGYHAAWPTEWTCPRCGGEGAFNWAEADEP
jgi:hypothetical protein